MGSTRRSIFPQVDETRLLISGALIHIFMKAMSDLDKGVAFRKNKGKSGTEDNLFAFVTPFQQSEQRTNLGRP